MTIQIPFRDLKLSRSVGITLAALGMVSTLAVAAKPISHAMQKVSNGCLFEAAEVCVPKLVSQSVVGISTPFGQGSAVIITKSGLIGTNAHVVAGADSVKIQLSDGRVFDGKVVAYHQNGSDLALIEISNPPDDLVPVKFSQTPNLQVGQSVFAIGNPFGLQGTVSSGSVSQLDSVPGYVQLNIALNQGNSGGALANSKGELIGITTATVDVGEGSTGIGLAIPIEEVNAFLKAYQAGEVPAPPSREPLMIQIGGEPIQGEISYEKSIPLEDGSFATFYQFIGQAGQAVQLTLASTSGVDPYLILELPDGTILEDDDGAGSTNARLALKLPVSGVYTVAVNTYEAEQFGDYTLVISR